MNDRFAMLCAKQLWPQRWQWVAAMVGVLLVVYLRNAHPPASWTVLVSLTLWGTGEVFFELTTSQRKLILCVSAVGVLLHLIGLAIWGYISPTDMSLLLDHTQYYREACAVADSWRNGFYPELTRKGELPYLGTLHVGYQRLLATAFLCLGNQPFNGIVLNLLSIPLLVFSTCYIVYQIVQKHQLPAHSVTRLQPETFAACLAALHLLAFFWMRVMQKDMTLAAVFMVALAACISLTRHFRPLVFVAVIALFGLLFSYRIYAVLSIILALGAYVFSYLNLKNISIALGMAILLWLCTRYALSYEKLSSQMIHSMAGIVPIDVPDSPFIGLQWMAQSLPRFFLAPYAWIIDSQTQRASYGMFPGMWLLYLLNYPMAAAGTARMFRSDMRLGLFILIPLVVNYYLLAMSYQGDATRQRFYIEYLFIVLASIGVLATKRQLLYSFIAVYSAITIFAICQVIRYYA